MTSQEYNPSTIAIIPFARKYVLYYEEKWKAMGNQIEIADIKGS